MKVEELVTMRLNKSTGDAIRILIACARAEGALVKVVDLSAALDITMQNVFKIVHILSRAGLTAAVRGRHGGIRLSRSADAIFIGDIVRAMEQTEAADRPSEGAASAVDVTRVLDDALEAFIAVLDRHSLADMVAREGLSTAASKSSSGRGRAAAKARVKSPGGHCAPALRVRSAHPLGLAARAALPRQSNELRGCAALLETVASRSLYLEEFQSLRSLIATLDTRARARFCVPVWYSLPARSGTLNPGIWSREMKCAASVGALAAAIALSSTVIGAALAAEKVNIYSYREPGLIDPLLKAFTAKTGIKTNVVFAKAGLNERLAAEGANSPADLLFTVDAGRLSEAKDAGHHASRAERDARGAARRLSAMPTATGSASPCARA